MCLYTEDKDPKTATEDMIVYKTVDYSSSDTIFISLYQRFVYLPGKLYCTPLSYVVREYLMIPNYAKKEISKGFHSYLRPLHAMGFRKIIRCTIPIGAKYYKGIDNDIVSDQIICNKLLK